MHDASSTVRISKNIREKSTLTDKVCPHSKEIICRSLTRCALPARILENHWNVIVMKNEKNCKGGGIWIRI